ncbi:MAG TPA: trigger factor [Solirubrobacteraceae bacterium]|nr:trigger factor [Solirubrobacteraceae bacterium]
MPGVLSTTLTELDDSRVRLEVEVPASEVQGRLERKARQLGRELKLPGFRRGKVPAPLVIQRIGREAVLEDAVRDTLASWYAEAIGESGIVPVGDPELDVGDLPEQGHALRFSIEIGVLPRAKLGEYRGLEVPRREPAVADDALDQEIAAMRERLARLETVERPAADGDFVVIDYIGRHADGDEQGEAFEGGEGRDQLIELGSGNLIPGFEEALRGAKAGEERTVEVTFPADYGAPQLAGRAAAFAVTVKEVKEKQLPAVDDELAIDSGFDDLEELRGDIRGRLLAEDDARAQAEFRQAALDAAVAAAEIPITPELTAARAKEMWGRMLHSLAHRGISREAYLQITGREEQAAVAELGAEAETALRREALITAVVAAENIEPSDEELLAALAPTAEREGVEPETLLSDLSAAGRLDDVREDLAARAAIDLIADAATPIEPATAKAREQIWTPEKEQRAPAVAAPGAAAGELWTPGEKGSAG